MKKRLLVLALLLMSGFALVGCGEEVAQGPKGLKGDNGANGKSAYELAVEQGYSGTEDEWIDSLTGPRGAEGQPGANGSNAEDGIEYELYVGEDGVIYQRVKGSQEAGEATFTIPVEEEELPYTLTGDDFNEMLAGGALPEGEQVFVGTYYKNGNYHCFRTGSFGTPELDSSAVAAFEALNPVADKTYLVTCTVKSVSFPFVMLEVTALEETELAIPASQAETVATGENQKLLVCPVEKDGVTTYYAAVNVPVNNSYLVVQEVHLNAEGKVIDATEFLVWNVVETEGKLAISSAKTGVAFGINNSTKVLAGGTGAGYEFTYADGLLKSGESGTRFLAYNSGSPRISAYNTGANYTAAQLMEAVVPAE